MQPTTNHDTNPHEQLITLKEICREFGVSSATLYRWVAAGVFPPPQTIGVGTKRWRRSVIENYKASPDAWKKNHFTGIHVHCK